MSNKPSSTPTNSEPLSPLSGFIQASGAILALSYPVLALSTGVRAIYQLGEGDPANSPWLTLIAATCYTIATIGFVKQPRPAPKNAKPPRQGWLSRQWQAISPLQAWKISLAMLALEMVMVLLVGALSYTDVGWFGRNVWQFFGRDYGYFPLIQPLLGLAWLLHPYTRRLYFTELSNR